MKRMFILLSGGAFLVLLLLIAALAVNGIYQLDRLQKQLDAVVELQNRKIETVTTMQVNVFARGDRLLRMAIERDPFSRDQLYLEFNRAGYLMGSARQHLMQLGLTPEEKELFDEQGRLIRKIEPMQERVTDFLARSEVENAWSVLVAEGIPMQEQLNAMLAGLREKMQQTSNLAMWNTRQEIQHNLYFTLLFGISATALGIALAWFTLRRLIANAREIEWRVEALQASRMRFEMEATHDAMTGLANRKLFYDRLRQALLNAKRHNSKVGVLFIDLDNFKEVNDIYGHHVGDALLSKVAEWLVASVRESDTVARAGGDEFLVLLGDPHGREDCQAAVDKIEAAMKRKLNLHGIELSVSASIGQAIYPDDGSTEDDLIRAADASMYRIKNSRPHPR